MRFRFSLLLAGLLLASCGGGPDPVDNDANGASLPQPSTDRGPEAAGEAPTSDVAPVTATSAGSIPASLHGRWGLNPADCTSTRGDAKGLLTVSATELRFYESRAVPGADVVFDDDSVKGRFNFTGEGMEWSKFQALQVQGNKLVRTETDPAASFTYAKC
ncbi:MAG TPA: hypothetical protein VIL42_07950 [Sphingomicrobium sp.]|jgi:hypothetical protein